MLDLETALRALPNSSNFKLGMSSRLNVIENDWQTEKQYLNGQTFNTQWDEVHQRNRAILLSKSFI